jgi:CheY-like chemotaxis protein
MTPPEPVRQKIDRTDQTVDFPLPRFRWTRYSVILVADDDALVRNLVTLLMQQDGYFVLSAADGHEGLELSRQYPGSIDLVITDVKMPRLNGTDLCAHLFEERPGIKLLVMSGEDVSECQPECQFAIPAQAVRRTDPQSESSGDLGSSSSAADTHFSLRTGSSVILIARATRSLLFRQVEVRYPSVRPSV